MNKSALEPTICSTNNAVAEVAETVVYLVQYEHSDEPGSFWPSRAFVTKHEAEKYKNKYNCEISNRFYSVVPLILEGK